MDLSTRIAPLYREKEMEIRNMISKSLERGKVDFSLWIEKDVSDTATPINAALVENYYNQIKSISEMTHIPMPEDWFATLLRMPDVLTKSRCTRTFGRRMGGSPPGSGRGHQPFGRFPQTGRNRLGKEIQRKD